MLPTTVSRAPSERAVLVIAAVAAGMPPASAASAFAASLPLPRSRACQRESTVYTEPGARPTFVPSMAASSGRAV